MIRSTPRKRWLFLGGLSGAAVTSLLVAVGVFVSSGLAARTAVPQPQSPPTVSGFAKEGQTLTGKNGTWSGNPTDFNFFWTRCDKTGGSCSNISGARSAKYKLTNADVGNTLRFKVEARNEDGNTFASSVPTAVVRSASSTSPPPASPPPSSPPPPSSNGCPSGSGPADIADISSPAHLILDGQQADPATVTANTQDITIRYHVSSSCGGNVKGALVYTTAVPFNQWSIPAETPTGSDGWASMTMHRLSGFPVGPHQQLIALFARARKSGESLLGGISARRLFSLRVNLRG
jgi:hypothetical protein